LTDDRWRQRPSIALGPGMARLNDSNFLMLRHVMELISPVAATGYRREVRALHRALSEGAGSAPSIARKLLATVDSLAQQLDEWEVDAESARILVASILDEGLSGEYSDYAAAEQAAMALQILIDALYATQAYERGVLEALASQLPALMDATRDPEAYRWTMLEAPLAAMRESLANGAD
ncbi:MAG: hypothetical protein AAEJ53_10675, partial [Myxococcota bacterium]